jgi:serine/threonine-protein phosphatase 2A regulatory subunit B''
MSVPLSPASFSLSLALNDLFFDWLSRHETKSAIETLLSSNRSASASASPATPHSSRSHDSHVTPSSSSPPSSARLSSPPHSFPHSSPPRSPQRRIVSGLSSPHPSIRSPNSLSSPLSAGSGSPSHSKSEFLSIRQFYFPDGIPVSPATKQRELSLINEIFKDSTTAGQSHTKSSIPPGIAQALSIDEFYPLTSLVCGFSSFFSSTLFSRVFALESDSAVRQSQRVRLSTFERYFVSELQNHDPPSRLHRMLRRDGRKYLIRDDFAMFVNELVHRHPGLEFLNSTPEFQVKYAQTVIGRIFYQINKSGSERLTIRELKSSNFLLLCALLDSEEDINKLNDYFSYEHFYVIYVKFWELDSDHNGLIDLQDLMQYEEY